MDPLPSPGELRSRRAMAPSTLWRSRIATLALLVLLGFLLGVLPSGRWDLAWALVVGSPRMWLVPLVVAYVVVMYVLDEVEARKPAPSWRVTEEGLVRTRGDQVRTFPWGRFRDVTVSPTSDGHGHLWLLRRNSFSLLPWMRVREGRVRLAGAFLCIPDVERAEELAEALRRRIR